MKRLIAITMTVMLLMLPAQALAAAKETLSYERAASLLNVNNSTLKKLQRAESDAYKQYQSNVLETGSVDVNGFTYVFNDKEYYYTYGAETRNALTKMKELVPDQMKFSWEAAKASRAITENSLKAALRGVFFGLYSSQNDLQLKQKQLSLASELNKQDQLKLKQGMITEIDMDESGYNLLKAQKSVDAAKRNFENATRSFNQFVGAKSEAEYTQVTYDENTVHPVLKPVEYYIDLALANRFDITSIRTQLALKEKEKKLNDSDFSQKISSTALESYERLLSDIEHLNVDLEGMKLSITEEIRNAYVDVLSSGKSLDSMYKTVKLQRSNYEKMQARYKSGMISKNMLEQSELGVLQVDNGYKAMLYDYKTKIMRFNNATGIGPEY